MKKMLFLLVIIFSFLISNLFCSLSGAETINPRTGAVIYSMNKYANTTGEVEVTKDPRDENLKIKFFVFNKKKEPVAIKGAFYYAVMKDGTIHFLERGPEFEVINPKSGLHKTFSKKYPLDKISAFFIKLTGEQNRLICFEYYPSIWDKIRRWVFGG